MTPETRYRLTGMGAIRRELGKDAEAEAYIQNHIIASLDAVFNVFTLEEITLMIEDGMWGYSDNISTLTINDVADIDDMQVFEVRDIESDGTVILSWLERLKG